MRPYYYHIYALLIGMFLITYTAMAQPKTVRFDQLESLQNGENRIIAIFIYSQWCKYCTAMKQSTFNQTEIKELLNNKFYFAMLDAEEKQPITWRGTTFQYKPTGVNTGVHELALQLGADAGEASYPILVFLNTQFEIIYQQKGFIAARDLEKILKTLSVSL